MKEKIIVELLGAPCAGKTSVNKLLESGFADLDYEVVNVGEAWDYLAPFASSFLDYARGLSTSLDKNSNFYLEQWWSQDAPEAILQKIQLISDVKIKSLYELYTFLHLGFFQEIDKMQNIDDSKLRLLFQRDLLRIQLFLEDWTNYPEHLAARKKRNRDELRIVEGGFLGILNYLYRQNTTDFVDIWRENLLPEPSKLTGLALPNLVVFMETICNLPPQVFLPFFYNGIRLDDPNDAVDLDARLQEILDLFYGSELILLLKAEQSVGEKAHKIKSWIKQALISPKLKPRMFF